MERLLPGVMLVTLATVLWAQQPRAASRKVPAQAKPSQSDAGAIAGTINDGVYHNPTFAFRYKLPYGWVDRTREMQDDSPSAAAKSLLLLAIFERPPEATGDSINSAVVIAAERTSIYSGMKTAADYFGPLTEVATAKGFQTVDEPREFFIGAKKFVRGDFSKARGTLTMCQTSLVALEKGYEVSFTFIGGGEDEVNELIEKLSFAPRKSAH